MNRAFVISFLACCTLTLLSCGGRKRDAAYYMAKVDSIRKVEQVREIQKKAGIVTDPIESWFDSLHIHTLPIKTAGSEIDEIGQFTPVPRHLNGNFGYPVSAKLKALSLPTAYRRPVVLMAEMVDSVTPKLFLYTMNKKHLPIDQLTLYEKKRERRVDDFGQSFMEYYITSRYEIILMQFYQSHHDERSPELLNTRRFVINKAGKFVEKELVEDNQ